jgi:hypothetical protein
MHIFQRRCNNSDNAGNIPLPPRNGRLQNCAQAARNAERQAAVEMVFAASAS